MPTAERYDALVIGSGEGGKHLAWHLAQAGEKVAVVERRWVGGSCPNINCLPSKNEIWSAGVARIVARAGEFGVTTGPVSVDMTKALQRKRDMVDDLVAFQLNQYEATGTEPIMGTARAVAPRTIQLGAAPEFHGRPSEMPDPVPFAQDHAGRPYDAEAVTRFFQACTAVERVLSRFRTAFLGKVSPSICSGAVSILR